MTVLYNSLVVSVIAIFTVCYYWANKKPGVALNPQKYKKFKLIKKIRISHDSFIFRFGFPEPKMILGLPVGHHISLSAMCKNSEGKEELVKHAYTPITSNDEVGYVDFMIKVYFANVNPRFPNGGRLTQHIHNMSIGDEIDMCGPQGTFIYCGQGNCKINRPGKGWQNYHVNKLAMIAGGSGITPMLQIIQAIHKDLADPTEVYLLYANNTKDDILMHGQLDALAKQDAKRVHVWYTVASDVSADWAYDVGFVTEEMMQAHIPSTSPEHKVMALMCGPPPMLQMAVKPNLTKMGYTADQIYAFEGGKIYSSKVK